MHAHNSASHCVEQDSFVYSTLNDRIDDDDVDDVDVMLEETELDMLDVVDDDVALGADVVLDIVELAEIVLDVVEVDVTLGEDVVDVVVDVSFTPEIEIVKTHDKHHK